MDTNVARKVLPFVNDIAHYDAFLAHVESRIETLRGFLEKEKEVDRIREIQGAIAELKRLYTLRDEVRGTLEHEKKNGR